MKSFKDTTIGREFLAGKIGIRCDTKGEYDRLMRMCEAEGLLWNGGERPCENSPVSDVASQRAIKLATNSSWHKGAIYFRNANESLNDGIEDAPFSALCAEPEKPAAPYDGRGKHKVGDLFEVVLDGAFNPGDIVRLSYDDKSECPEFERVSDGKQHFCFWHKVKPAPAPTTRKIIITTDGTTTTARLMEGKTTLRTATATCSPSDTFDFDKGARLAFDRLIDDGKCRDLHVRVNVDTSAAKAAIQSVIDALNDLPNQVKVVRP